LSLFWSFQLNVSLFYGTYCYMVSTITTRINSTWGTSKWQINLSIKLFASLDHPNYCSANLQNNLFHEMQHRDQSFSNWLLQHYKLVTNLNIQVIQKQCKYKVSEKDNSLQLAWNNGECNFIKISIYEYVWGQRWNYTLYTFIKLSLNCVISYKSF